MMETKAKKILGILKKYGDAHIVGGAVRDLVIGVE